MNKRNDYYNEEKQTKNSFAIRSFREIADYDYIAARTLFKNQLFDPFLYLAHQSVEKYLKGILLFHDVKFPKPIHDLEEILKKIKKMKSVNLEKTTELFIKDLNQTVHARYLSAPFYAEKDYLLKLDEAVWDLRFFCQPVETNLRKIKDKTKLLDYSLRGGSLIPFGVLEKVIRNKEGKFRKIRENLIWKNFRFGSRRKKSIKFASGVWSKNPDFFIGTNEENRKKYEILSKYVYFPGDVKKYFKGLR